MHQQANGQTRMETEKNRLMQQKSQADANLARKAQELLQMRLVGYNLTQGVYHSMGNNSGRLVGYSLTQGVYHSMGNNSGRLVGYSLTQGVYCHSLGNKYWEASRL